MIRLPQYDTKTRRAELAAFVALGCLGLAVVSSSILDAGRFAGKGGELREPLIGGQPAEAVIAEVPTNHSATNLTGGHPLSRSEHAS